MAAEQEHETWVGVDKVARMLDIQPRTVDRMVARGALPPPIRLSGRTRRWRRRALEQFLIEQESPTAQLARRSSHLPLAGSPVLHAFCALGAPRFRRLRRSYVCRRISKHRMHLR